MELESYKHLLKESDISKDKNEKLQTVMNDFQSTEAYFKDQVQRFQNPTEMCKETWGRIVQSVGTNIGPTGSVRKKVGRE